MKKFRTVDQAKKEVIELQAFIHLAETYKVNTLKRLIIKEYAYLGSIAKVAEKLRKLNHTRDEDGIEIDSNYVKKVITGQTEDQLHKILKSCYLLKTRHLRTKSKTYSYY